MFSDIGKLESKYQTLFAIIIAFAVISFWRGIWGLMGIYMFPDNLPLSFLVSILIGLVILAATHYTTKELV